VLDQQWSDSSQRDRALQGLLQDGLVVAAGSDAFTLP
jgi:hypothetical protein